MQAIQSSNFSSISFVKNYGCHISSKSLILSKPFFFEYPRIKDNSLTLKPFLGRIYKPKKGLIVEVISRNLSSPNLAYEQLEASNDEYEGVIIDNASLPLTAKAFAPALRASLSSWKLKEGFSYHHAEPGYVMLTYWIPNIEPCSLPASPSHQIGIAGFVINDKRESEDIFSGAIREVKEETGVDTNFIEMVAFRHAHLVAFEKSDLMFVCMLKPLSADIKIDVDEIDAAKWMTVEEVLEQSFYSEDHMLRKIIEVCMANYERNRSGFVAHHLTSKFDGNIACLYYNDILGD